jgi:hypothetical protein
MSFNAQANRVRNAGFSLGYRRRALANCIEHFCLLTCVPYQTAVAKLRESFQIDPVTESAELTDALIALGAERDRYKTLLLEYRRTRGSFAGAEVHPSRYFANTVNFARAG